MYMYTCYLFILIDIHYRGCLLKEDIVIAENTDVGENSHISHSVIGKNCHIGKNVTICNSYIWDNVTVGVRQMC
jgi:translation initiation factor eIF-2B subunit epsilon